MNKVHLKNKFILVGFILLLATPLFVLPVSATSGWFKPRPSASTTFDERIENSYTNGHASVGVGVHICEYTEGTAAGYDYLHFRISVSANTRVDVKYDIKEGGYLWYDEMYPNSKWWDTGITGDDAGVNLTLPLPVLFYGVEYNYVWVCSNGFLSFDSQSTSYISQAIPNTNKPNTLIAPFWRDLDPSKGGSITYGVIGEALPWAFVISWNDVPNFGNDAKQSFQVVIFTRDPTIPFLLNYHNTILFQYKSITKDYPTVVGVEDQVGDRGSSYDYNSLNNESALEVRYPSPGYRLNKLKIKLSKSDSYATIDILEGFPKGIGGYNVELQSTSNPFGDLFLVPVEVASTVLLTGKAGIVFGLFLITAETALTLAEALSPPHYGVKDALESDNEAYVEAWCFREELTGGDYRPFDATLAAPVTWCFTDPNNRSHYLTITAELVYYDLTYSSYHTISTSVSMSMYISSGGGGGCPILFVWNGTHYFEEGLLDIHNPEGVDVVYQHTLVTMPERVNGAYLFRLVEHPQTYSHIDHVKLYAILKDGTAIELPLIYAWHSEDGNVLPQLLFSDDWKVDEYGANWNNGVSQSIDLKFAALNPNMKAVGFVFQIEGNNIVLKR